MTDSRVLKQLVLEMFFQLSGVKRVVGSDRSPTAPFRPRKVAWLSLVLLAGCSGSPDPGDGENGASSTGGTVSGPDNSTGGGTADTGGSGSGGLIDPLGVGGSIGTGGLPEAPSGGTGSVNGTGGAPLDVLPPSTEAVIEENQLGFCFVDGIIETTNAGFSGAGYANADNALGSAVGWAVQISEAGTYSLEFTYANGGAADRTGALSVNGSEVNATASFPPTNDWTTWTTASFDVSLSTGQNRITLSAVTAEGLANIDSVKITGAALAPLDCSPVAATGGAPGTGGMDMGTGGNGQDLPDTTIYVAGDSTVSNYTDTASPNDQAGWGQMLHEIFDDRVTVENRALGGRTALWFHLEGETQYVLDRIQPGEYWFIQFGTNDSHPTATFTVDNVTYQRLAPANTTFKEHLLDYYINPARAINAIPVLVTPPPRNSAYCGNGNSLGGYAQAMRDLGAAEDVLVLDLNQRTFDHLAAICPSPTPEDFFFLRADNTVDGTHFQENGARHMAGFLGDEMTSQSAGPFQYLLP